MKKSFFRTALPVAAVLLLSVIVAFAFIATRPKPEMAPEREFSIPVKVHTSEYRSQKIVVTAMGTVVPARELDLIPEVGGRVVEVNSKMMPGAYINEGEVLLRIDKRDYSEAVRQAAAQLANAKSSLKIEQGRQEVAKREWEFLKETGGVSGESSSLALRKPQLASAEAAVSSARSAWKQARLNLERTTIKAPFNLVVIEESVEVGQIVSPQTKVASLVGADTYRVQVSLPMEKLKYIKLPLREGETGSEATVVQEIGESNSIKRKGRVIKLLGDLDSAGRMARLLVEVEDPLGMEKTVEERGLPLLIESYVRVDIDGPVLDNIFVLPREAVHDFDKVWIMSKNDTLEIRVVKVLWRNAADVIVGEGIEPGERIVVSNIQSPVNGTLLAIENNKVKKKTEERKKSPGR